MNNRYAWHNGHEHLRTQGAKLPIQVLILPALFDEANRMRRFTVQLMHRLAAAGIGSMLPDLPGTAESEVELARVSFTDWAMAIQAVAKLLPPGPRRTVSIRGGALLDRQVFQYADAVHGAWRLSPEPGTRLVRDLQRTQNMGGQAELGYSISPEFFASADEDEYAPSLLRTVRLASDPAPADLHIEGTPLWRRAEPGEDEGLLDRIAADIIEWVNRCGA